MLDSFGQDQLYMLCFMESGGQDLESFLKEKSGANLDAGKIQSIIHQISASLAIAERARGTFL